MTDELVATNSAAARACSGYSRQRREATGDDLVFIASLNEWSEGHSIEPDTRFGFTWLEAIREARVR